MEFRACPISLPLLGATAVAQQPDDLGQECHALVLAVCVVESMDAALDHIARYGSNHTEIICTNNHEHAMRFLREADASMVAVNASSRFNDGGQLGLGAEIGISTSKLHAYGPMGVDELTQTKFVVFGQGKVRGYMMEPESPPPGRAPPSAVSCVYGAFSVVVHPLITIRIGICLIACHSGPPGPPFLTDRIIVRLIKKDFPAAGDRQHKSCSCSPDI